MATQSVRIGWRPYVNLTSAQSAANLLDSYSGAAVAYSLRKLKSSYTGSAIRVRRSSDNTELNIGFDSDGNLDTYSLSAFVGTGNGFVTTWYDQSGNGNNLIQTTAANQPSIILSGIINTQNNKPVLITDGSSFMVNNSVSWSSTTNSIFATIKLTSTRGSMAMLSSVGTSNQHFVSRNVNGTGRYYDSGGQEITAAALPNGFNLIGIHENTSGVTVFENGSNLVTNFAHDTGGTLTGIVVFRRDAADNNYLKNGSGFSELVIYGTSKLSDNSVISNNINTYYSVYPNPTSVWNLLSAAYNADTTASSSLKTSLFAVYNAESNANDSFGSNNGTAQGGLTYTTGKIGNAFTFNGTNAYVRLPRTTNQFDFTGNFSISLWFNQSVNGNLFNNYYGTSTTNRYGYALYVQGGRVRFATYKGNTAPLSASNIGQSPLNIIINTWYHVVITKTTSNAFKMYINGVLQSLGVIDGDLSLNPVYSPLNTVDIGAEQGISQFLNGKIDSLNVWNKELTASEVSELYNSGNGAQYITDSFYKPTTNDALLVRNGTPQGGLTYGVGKVGTAFVGNGTNGYVSLPTDSFNNLTGDFSISLWCNIVGSKIDGVTHYLFANTNAPTWFNNPGGFNIVAYNNTLEISIFDKTNTYGTLTYVDYGSVIQRGTWQMYTFTRSGNVLTIYVNGTQVAQATKTTQPIFYSGSTTPSIFCFINNGTLRYAGTNGTKYDGFNIWQKALTQSEITELYNSGNGKQYPN